MKKYNFTLTEVAAILVMTALCAALAIPAVHATAAAGKNVGCMDNLRKIGNLLQNESPVNKVCMHVRFIGLVLAAMMIINGIVFCIIAKEKENC